MTPYRKGLIKDIRFFRKAILSIEPADFRYGLFSQLPLG